ncbi:MULTISPECIES: HEPN domain-containing protein [Deinococcus]|uniref:HEPN domain-containing protein n=1 Tax=Deinococcus rufus TaxID=2136097 RepID=A0ABV7ZFV3_9DEIO|nr:HEPN domain-containing protein [Deinococcus sp. AB2017081]WQE96808.1 HEPN domain-containing protein [Deinococcus sp. AB2017081]
MGAAASLREGIALVDALIGLENTHQDPPPMADIEKVAALRGAAVVLTVAAFEDYVKLRVQEAVKYINTHMSDHRTYDFKRLPIKLLTSHYFLTLQYATRGNGYDGKKREDRIDDIHTAAIDIAANRLDPLAFSNTGGNPNPDTVSEMLKNLGIIDPFAQIKPIYETITTTPVAETYIKDKLDSLIKVRNIVAHSAKSGGIPRADVLQFRQFAENLSEALNTLLDKHCEAIVLSAQKP